MKYYNISITEDGYDLKVKGCIRPVKSVTEYDFSKLVDLLIRQGVPKDEARREVRELCEEIVSEIRKKEEGDD